ncbi:MAG: Chaperone protein Skp precursor [Pseudomonadota bacterium]
MKTLRHFSQVCLLAFGALGAIAVSAQEFKIGFVNTDRIFREASTAKTAQAKLEQEFSKREKDLVDLGNTIKTASDKFEREAPEFQRKRREFQEDLNTRKNEEQQVVIERANRAVKVVAEAEKYDVIFQEAVYINPKHDITDKVIKSLNATAGK